MPFSVLPDRLRREPQSRSTCSAGGGGASPKGRVVWHTGHYAGFVNVWLLAPEADLTIVVLSNGSISEPDDLAEKMLEHPNLQ